MGSKSDNFENQILLHIFNKSAIAYVGDTAGLPASGTPGNLYVSLHTGTIEDTTNQDTTETTYTNYVRQAVPRSGAGWTVSNNTVNPAADIDFPECGATPGAAVTHFAIGKEADGGG